MFPLSFLGFVIEKGQLKTGPSKIRTVVDFYHRFVMNFHGVAALLTKLTSNSVPFH